MGYSCLFVIGGGQQEQQEDAYHGYGRPQQSEQSYGHSQPSHGYQKPDIQQAAQYAKQHAPDNDEGKK